MPREGRKKGDRKPDEGTYRDTGCNLAPKCLSCPFSLCQYDRVPLTSHQTQMLRANARWTEIRRLHDTGLSPVEVSKQSNIPLRTVQRALKEQR